MEIRATAAGIDGGRLRGAVCLVAGVVGLVVVVVCFYPGYMWWDSNNQYRQATTGGYVDWQPPLMSYVWSRFKRITPGPIGMLVFHKLMFLTGMALLTYLTRLPTFLTPVALLGVGVFP